MSHGYETYIPSMGKTVSNYVISLYGDMLHVTRLVMVTILKCTEILNHHII